MALPAGRPMPIRSRGYSVVPSSVLIEFSPLCPPDPPDARSRIRPGGRSMSSSTTRMFAGRAPNRVAAYWTASPLALTKVRGFARTTGRPGDYALADDCVLALVVEPDARPLGEQVDAAEADVVPGAFVPRARVA